MSLLNDTCEKEIKLILPGKIQKIVPCPHVLAASYLLRSSEDLL